MFASMPQTNLISFTVEINTLGTFLASILSQDRHPIANFPHPFLKSCVF